MALAIVVPEKEEVVPEVNPKWKSRSTPVDSDMETTSLCFKFQKMSRSKDSFLTCFGPFLVTLFTTLRHFELWWYVADPNS